LGQADTITVVRADTLDIITEITIDYMVTECVSDYNAVFCLTNGRGIVAVDLTTEIAVEYLPCGFGTAFKFVYQLHFIHWLRETLN
jgi:hypothetical protein